MYWWRIALALKETGFFVFLVDATLIHDFSDNSVRKVKRGMKKNRGDWAWVGIQGLS